LKIYNDDRREDVESFLYWSKEELGGGKPIITITHVSMIPIPREAQTEMVVASKQVFATHYLSASLSLTSVTTASRSGTGTWSTPDARTSICFRDSGEDLPVVSWKAEYGRMVLRFSTSFDGGSKAASRPARRSPDS
jgi:hypothetical protein